MSTLSFTETLVELFVQGGKMGGASLPKALICHQTRVGRGSSMLNFSAVNIVLCRPIISTFKLTAASQCDSLLFKRHWACPHRRKTLGAIQGLGFQDWPWHRICNCPSWGPHNSKMVAGYRGRGSRGEQHSLQQCLLPVERPDSCHILPCRMLLPLLDAVHPQ